MASILMVAGRPDSASLGFPAEAEPSERDETPQSDHEVIDDLDVEQAAGLHGCLRELDIGPRWARIAGRMVMEENHRGSIDPDRFAEEFGHPYLGSTDVPLRDRNGAEYPVARIEQDDPELLLLERRHLRPGDGVGIFRSVDGWAFLRTSEGEASTEFECCLELGCLGRAQTTIALERCQIGARQSSESAEFDQ